MASQRGKAPEQGTLLKSGTSKDMRLKGKGQESLALNLRVSSSIPLCVLLIQPLTNRV